MAPSSPQLLTAENQMQGVALVSSQWFVVKGMGVSSTASLS